VLQKTANFRFRMC